MTVGKILLLVSCLSKALSSSLAADLRTPLVPWSSSSGQACRKARKRMSVGQKSQARVTSPRGCHPDTWATFSLLEASHGVSAWERAHHGWEERSTPGLSGGCLPRHPEGGLVLPFQNLGANLPDDRHRFKGSNFLLLLVKCNAEESMITGTHNCPRLGLCGCVSVRAAQKRGECEGSSSTCPHPALRRAG